VDEVDFRSDTVTWPTPAMREAMARARVGDDVYGEDPTVNELESRGAALTGKEAGLFVVSGTMGNLAAILAHAGRGDEAIGGRDAHTFVWEAGGMATLGGVVPHSLPTDSEGRMAPTDVEAAVRDDDPHLPRSRLVLLENSYGARNGFPLPPAYFAVIRAVADRHRLAVHLDGARLFNAAVALGLPADALTAAVDSVSFCLSKGLGAPAGSVLCGSADFIHRARRARKALGGAMRQAGVLAAAGLVALERIPALAHDHEQAARLAAGLAGAPGIQLHPTPVRTNIVYFHLVEEVPLSAAQAAGRLRERTGIRVGVEGPRTLRAVAHHWIRDQDVEALITGMRGIVT
jgi:threonine aldolase